MKYWHGDKFVAQSDIKDGQSRAVKGYPASKGKVLDYMGKFKRYYELEIVPGTRVAEDYFDPTSYYDYESYTVTVILRDGSGPDGPWYERTVVMSLDSFGLDDIPPDPASAYDRAMRVI